MIVQRPLGCHVSIAGGIDRSIERAAGLQLGAVQIFSKNASRWQAPPLDPDAVERFKFARAKSSIAYMAVHDSYLINLASPDPESWQRSIDAFVDELKRCKTLGIGDLVMHPGSHLGSGESTGLQRVCAALGQALERTGQDVRILLETTAGQGTNLGWRFEHLAEIIATSPYTNLAVCFDSCHVLAAGYDLCSPQAVTAVLNEFDARIGLTRLALFHLNDSIKGCGSRIDRHQHIGRGEIGATGFAALLQDPRVSNVPGVIETPSGTDHCEDHRNLNLLRQLSKEVLA
ncbi:deoxyribonuclease IV [Geopsychrobacter electrodiphilus]|uniref:deoxyribonuclease IV n=1 Tax=Geopsychrobacter electrodiphilus TaxID=225196 RepID=UPI000361FB92|nr:deoxyribonuclease IV [Geopsychrobacter electrodiphilus]